MIRIIATDLDDTLLTKEWSISDRNTEVIRQAAALGVKVILATGRMAVSARKYAQELGLDLPIITYHGALVEQGLSREIMYRKVIPSFLAAQVAGFLMQRGIFIQVYLKDRVFTGQASDYTQTYARMTGIEVEKANIAELLAREPEGLEKILCLGEEDQLAIAAAALKTAFAGRIHVTSSKRNNLEIVSESVNKGEALRQLAEGWNIRADEVMAIGDSLNDKEMITYAGIGVAVANAHPELKKIADYVTLSHVEDGVARAIEKFALNN